MEQKANAVQIRPNRTDGMRTDCTRLDDEFRGERPSAIGRGVYRCGVQAAADVNGGEARWVAVTAVSRRRPLHQFLAVECPHFPEPRTPCLPGGPGCCGTSNRNLTVGAGCGAARPASPSAYGRPSRRPHRTKQATAPSAPQRVRDGAPPTHAQLVRQRVAPVQPPRPLGQVPA